MSFGKPPSSGTVIPPTALWLGLLGLLPFAAGAAGAWLLPPGQGILAATVVAFYGGAILSFLGGVHWGLAAPSGPALQMGFSVVPSLVAWGGLLTSVFGSLYAALWLLALAFAMLLVCDFYAARRQLTPLWYPRLRLPLSLGAIVSLIAAAFA